MKIKYLFFALCFLMILGATPYSCKSQKKPVVDNKVPIILLLDQNAKVKAIQQEYYEWTINEFKQTSRSQNLWTFNCYCNEAEVQELLAKMNAHKSIVSAKMPAKPTGATNSTSSKRVKTKPIRKN